MTTNVIELIHGTIAPSATGSVTITTALVPTDRVALVVVKNTTSGTPVPSGLGTWTTHANLGSPMDVYLYSTTGVTGGGTFTITISQPSSSEYAAYVLRSDTGLATTPTIPSMTSGSVVTGTINTPITTLPAGTSPAGSFVIAVGWGVIGSTISFPHAASVPSGGWTIDHSAASNISIASRISPSDESILPAISSSLTGSIVTGRTAFYDNVVPGGPIENRLHGIYAEVLEVEGPSAVRLHQAYGEVLEAEGGSVARLHTAYLEVLTTVTETTPPVDVDMGGTWGG